MGTTPVCRITEAGIVRPAFDDCLNYVQAAYRGIYGQDVYLGADSQDGQFMALLANAIHDCNGETVAAYNAFSPATAQGNGLTSVVKINGVRRKTATFSSVDLLLVGQVGSLIQAGRARDQSGNLWALPDTVTIPEVGQILVTATCTVKGAVAAPIGAVSAIATPTLGWQSVTNPDPATPGLPVETDAQLRQRQTISTGIPAKSIIESMTGALAAIQGVVGVRVYENDTNLIDAHGIPAHAIAAVIEGGDVDNIAQVMTLKKGPGVGMYGSTVLTVVDAYGIPHAVGFFRPRLVPTAYYIRVRPLRGYSADVEDQVRQSVADWTNALSIGNDVQLSRVYDPASLDQAVASGTYEILPNGIVAARDGFAPGPAIDLKAAFDERFVCEPRDVNIVPVLS